MSRKNKATQNENKSAFTFESISKIVSIISTLLLIFTTIIWWKTDSENKILDNKIKNLEIQLKNLNVSETALKVSEAELKNYQLKPRFSVQYMIFGGAVYAAIKEGDINSNDESTFGKIKKNKDAKAAFETLYEYPLIETDLYKHMESGDKQIHSFIKKYSSEPLNLKDRIGDYNNALKYTIISISCFGGTTAKNVELVYEERTLKNELFMLPPEGIRYVDNPIQYINGAPIQSESLPYTKKTMTLKLGDIEPGHGRIIPIQVGYSLENVLYKSGDPVKFEIISSFHLKPLKIKFTTLSGEVIEQPIREQLDIPMPVSDFIDARG